MGRRTDFERDGFVAQSSFYSGDELLSIEDVLGRFIAERVPSLRPEHVFYEDKADRATLKQIQRMHAPDGFFAELCGVLVHVTQSHPVPGCGRGRGEPAARPGSCPERR